MPDNTGAERHRHRRPMPARPRGHRAPRAGARRPGHGGAGRLRRPLPRGLTRATVPTPCVHDGPSHADCKGDGADAGAGRPRRLTGCSTNVHRGLNGVSTAPRFAREARGRTGRPRRPPPVRRPRSRSVGRPSLGWRATRSTGESRRAPQAYRTPDPGGAGCQWRAKM